MDDNFVAEYITDCAKNGVASPPEICEKAKEEIKNIDQKILEINSLRMRKKNLLDVLKSFGHDSTKRPRKNVVPSVIGPSANEEMNPEFLQYIKGICKTVEEKSRSVSPREIMDSIGGLEHNQIVYLSIKWLCDKGILTRKEDRTLTKGVNWNTRPD